MRQFQQSRTAKTSVPLPLPPPELQGQSPARTRAPRPWVSPKLAWQGSISEPRLCPVRCSQAQSLPWNVIRATLGPSHPALSFLGIGDELHVIKSEQIKSNRVKAIHPSAPNQHHPFTHWASCICTARFPPFPGLPTSSFLFNDSNPFSLFPRRSESASLHHNIHPHWLHASCKSSIRQKLLSVPLPKLHLQETLSHLACIDCDDRASVKNK